MPPKAKKAGKKAPRQKTPKVRMKIEGMLDVKHLFTEKERIDIGERMTAAMTSLETVKEAKKTVAKEYDSKIKAFEQQIGELHGQLRDGHEFRPTPVIVHFNRGTRNGKPVIMKGVKRICRKDNGEFIRDEPMTHIDMQDELLEVQKQERKTEEAKAKPPTTKPAEEVGSNTDSPHLNVPAVPDKPGETASTAATA